MGKPIERWRRKVTGLREIPMTAGLQEKPLDSLRASFRFRFIPFRSAVLSEFEFGSLRSETPRFARTAPALAREAPLDVTASNH